MPRVSVALAVAMVSLMASACTSQPSRSEHRDSASVETTVGRRKVCTPTSARDLVERFLRATEKMENPKAVVDVYVAPEPAFQWFSTRDRIEPDAMDRSSLSGYLEKRREQDLQQHVAEFSFNGVDGRGHANFGFVLRESSPGGTLRYPGKGAIDCTTGKLIVWSEGSPA